MIFYPPFAIRYPQSSAERARAGAIRLHAPRFANPLLSGITVKIKVTITITIRITITITIAITVTITITVTRARAPSHPMALQLAPLSSWFQDAPVGLVHRARAFAGLFGTPAACFGGRDSTRAVRPHQRCGYQSHPIADRRPQVCPGASSRSGGLAYWGFSYW